MKVAESVRATILNAHKQAQIIEETDNLDEEE